MQPNPTIDLDTDTTIHSNILPTPPITIQKHQAKMNPSPPKPTNTNTPYHPNDYWDIARSPDDKNPVHSLTALPGHIPTTRVSPSPSPSPLPSPGANSTARLTPLLGQQDVSRGRSTGKTHAQELKLRSRSPRFVPFGGEQGSSSGPRSEGGSRADSDSDSGAGAGTGLGPNYSPAGAAGHGNGGIPSAATTATTREHQAADPERQDQRQDQDQNRDDEVVMSSTAYPGQEWRPAALGQWEDF